MTGLPPHLAVALDLLYRDIEVAQVTTKLGAALSRTCDVQAHALDAAIRQAVPGQRWNWTTRALESDAPATT